MRALTAKLLRDLRRATAQYAAIALVMACGIAVTVMAFSTVESLAEARDRYYTASRFAEVFATLRRAPAAVIRGLEAIDGVQQADGRVVEGALIDLPTLDRPAAGSIVSLPDDPATGLNRIVLRAGRLPERGRASEVLVLESFFQANGLSLGDRVEAILGGRLLGLTIVGTALSPEYILTMPPGGVVPDARRFAVLWMRQDALAQAADLDGAVNAIALDLAPGASVPAVIDQVSRRLAPYGVLDVIGREDQPSHAFLEGEFTQLRALGSVIPPIFLGVAAFLLSSVLRRQIELERGQIGLLKAFGFTNREVATHYAGHAVVIGIVGVAAGAAAGALFAQGLNGIYTEFYRFPAIQDRFSLGGLLFGTVIGVGASLGGVWAALRSAVRLTPAVAMAPAAPEVYRHSGLDLGRYVDAPTQMILRNLGRRPGRALMTLAGLALSMALLVGTSFVWDSVRLLADQAFFRAQRWQVNVTFAEPMPERSWRWLARLPGVLAAEPSLSIPVRLLHGARAERTGITGLPVDSELLRVTCPAGDPVPLPPRGLVLSRALAAKLAAGPGDRVRVEVLDRGRPVLDLPVVGVSNTWLGLSAHMQLDALQRLLGEDGVVGAVSLLADSDRLAALYRVLRRLPRVAALDDRDDTVRRFNDQLTRSLRTTMTFYVGFAAVVAFGVAYNAARVSLSERARDLATMRVMGFSRGESVYVLVGELGLLVLAAIPLGCLLGYGIAWFFTTALSTDLYRFPLVVTPRTYGFAALVTVVVTAASALFVGRQVGRLDLLAVLKTRE